MRWKGAWTAGVRPTLGREMLSALAAAAAVGVATGLCASALTTRINPSLRDPRDATLFLLTGAAAYVLVFLPLGLFGLVCVRWIGFWPRGGGDGGEAGQEGAAPEGVDPRVDPRAAEARSRFPFSTHAAVLLAGVGAYALAVSIGTRSGLRIEADRQLLTLAVAVALAVEALAAFVATRRLFQGLIGPRRWLIPIVLLFLSGLFLLLGIGGGEVVAAAPVAEESAPEGAALGGPGPSHGRRDPALALLPQPQPRHVIVLALDGADWERIDALMALGELPAFRRLLASAVRTPLRGEAPAWSPVAWTTVATGVPPSVHGVRDLSEVVVPGLTRGVQRSYARRGEPPLLPPGLGLRPLVDLALDHLLTAGLVEERLVGSTQRRSKAVWNILSERGLSVVAVRWPASRPAESLYGFVVANDEPWTGDLRVSTRRDPHASDAGLFAPFELREELADLLVSTRSGEGLGPPAAVPVPRPPRAGEETPPDRTGPPPPLPIFARLAPAEQELLEREPDLRLEAREVLAADAFGARAALRLWRERRPQFLAVCLRALDVLGHRMQHLPGAVDGTYRWMDEALGAWLEAAGEDATLVVVSAYGQPDAAGRHEEQGILVLSGAHVRVGAQLAAPPSLYDLAPTLLALYGLPPSEEMPGRPLLEALELETRTDTLPRPRSYGPYSVRQPPIPVAAVAGAKAAQGVGE